MKKIGFIGAYDKTDLIIYVAKILTTLEKKVLVIDATINQKARYVVPVINPTKMYITEYEQIDIAVGFSDMVEIKRYLGLSEQQELEYDIVLVDVDNIKSFQIFKLQEADKNYFVTSFDNYSLKKGLEILGQLNETIDLTKILFTKEILKEDDDYLNFLATGYKVIWDDLKLYFPIENGDLIEIYENQRAEKIRFRKISIQYKDGLAYIVEGIVENISEMNIRKAIKYIEKGV